MGHLDPQRLPVIDLSRFDAGDPWRQQVAAQVDRAACRFGSFQIVGHGVDSLLMETLAELNGKLFALGAEAGDEIRFGPSSSRTYRAVLALPAHWRVQNAYHLPGLREAVQEYMTVLTGLGHKLMTLFARGLHLNDGYFVDRHTGSPDTLLRVIAHPAGAEPQAAASRQPVPGTLLTLVMPDAGGGLDVWHEDRRLEVSPAPGALVCLVGTGLERLSGGRYTAARHGLRTTAGRMQLSLVFSFDPGEEQAVRAAEKLPLEPLPLPLALVDDDDDEQEEEEALDLPPERLVALRAVMPSAKSR